MLQRMRTNVAWHATRERKNGLAMSNPKATAYDEVKCPNCGLALQVSQDPKALDLRYDREEWARRCKNPGLNSPARCLAEAAPARAGAQALKAAPFEKRPLYLQLREELIERIAKGEWKPGAAIPNEGDLAREFGVSAGTMRKALDLMESERLVTRRQGRGTYVADQSAGELAHRFMNICGPDGERLIGEVASVEVTAAAANEMECERLGLRAGDRVYRIRRVRRIKNNPFLVEEASMPAALFPGLESMSAVAHYIVSLAQKYGILLGKGEERISIAAASADIAGVLGIASGSPIAVLDRVVWDIDERPIEWRLGRCQLDRNYVLWITPTAQRRAS